MNLFAHQDCLNGDVRSSGLCMHSPKVFRKHSSFLAHAAIQGSIAGINSLVTVIMRISRAAQCAPLIVLDNHPHSIGSSFPFPLRLPPSPSCF
jgi:hypothetical protein